MMGESALAFQRKLDAEEETMVGVNKYRIDETEERDRRPLERPDMARMEAHLLHFKAFKDSRSQAEVTAALDALARAANASPGSPGQNVFAAAVEAAIAGCTHGEICGRLRREMGFGEPMVLA
jgi:methylmalonyl-CoA mutase N-terminal domain/subunit